MKEIVYRPVETPVDRTKARWVAEVYREFGKAKTTVPALYYFALGRKAADYPICGGFVGEIRAMRQYHETDCPKLEKWVDRAKLFGHLRGDAILEPLEGDFIPPEAEDPERPRIELWLSRPALAPLVLPVCQKRGAGLVSAEGRPAAEMAERLIGRAKSGGRATLVLCLSDLSPAGVAFCGDLASLIRNLGAGGGYVPEIRAERIGLSPQQVRDLGIPTIPWKAGTKEERKSYARRVKPQGLDPERIAELDALEAYHPGGIARFVEGVLARLADEGFDPEGEERLV
jgi:hypothetical protein